VNTFLVSGRCIAAPPPADWREQLAAMLGEKPRRIGGWAELGLYGALHCMADAGETTLPHDALVILASQRGPYAATIAALEQMRDDLPMPLAFLQTQPSQLLALLAAQVKWQGNANFLAGTELQSILFLAAAQAGSGGLLLGSVDEMAGGLTHWLRLRPCEAKGIDFKPAFAGEIFSPQVSYLNIAPKSLHIAWSDQDCIGGRGMER
jgi:hypothetical protein